MEKHRYQVRAFQSNRSQLLFTNSNEFSKSCSGASSTNRSNSTAQEAASIQKSLFRTQTLLQQELQRVSHVSTVIEKDGELLSKTMDDQNTMNVGKAKKALTALQLAQQRERHVLMASVIFFSLVVAYVLWERVVTRLPFFDFIEKMIEKCFGVAIHFSVIAGQYGLRFSKSAAAALVDCFYILQNLIAGSLEKKISHDEL